MERTAKALYDKLKQNKSGQLHLCFQFFPKKNHGDTLHLAVYDSIEKIYGHMNKKL